MYAMQAMYATQAMYAMYSTCAMYAMYAPYASGCITLLLVKSDENLMKLHENL